jgi:hypothetical protein
MKKWCPRCDQGWVSAYRHRSSGEVVLICEECEALWKPADPFDLVHFHNFDAYFEELHQAMGWTALEAVADQ